MKIGILTLSLGCNYGGVLQCFALQTYLESLGHDVQVINYSPSTKPSFFQRLVAKLKTIGSVSDFLHNIIDFSKIKNNVCKTSVKTEEAISKIFEDFIIRRLKLSCKVDEISIHNLQHTYDAVIVGSDQVWTNLYGKRKIYFFDWLDEEFKGKRLAYAACSAHKFVQGKSKLILDDLLSKMDAIGVRDITTKSLVNSIDSELKTDIVADPTLLYDFSEFEDNRIPESPYILTYLLGTEIRGGHKKALNKIKDVVGDIPVISIILPDRPSGIESVSDEIISDATPEKWVALIRNAEVLYTDSFHGIMFSLKYKIKFLGYYANAIRSSRLIDLKERFPNLPIYNEVPIDLNLTYEWSGEEFTEHSKSFLIKNL